MPTAASFDAARRDQECFAAFEAANKRFATTLLEHRASFTDLVRAVARSAAAAVPVLSAAAYLPPRTRRAAKAPVCLLHVHASITCIYYVHGAAIPRAPRSAVMCVCDV